MDQKIVSIYENIYNKELDWKNNLDNKFSSRLTILVTITTATFIIFSTIFFSQYSEAQVIENITLQVFCKVISALSIVLWIIQCCFFYQCFFRIKKNYKVMPTVDIRMFHFYIHKNNLLGSKDENDLYNYLNDSYQFCAYTNANINSRRERALIFFDNITSISFLSLIISYILMILSGYSISWIF